jgi:thiamine biosynthesis lipoprotein
MPLSGIKSVTVFSPRAELSDALATAIYVKGVVRGVAFTNQLPQTHCIIIDNKNKIYFSEKLNYENVGV